MKSLLILFCALIFLSAGCQQERGYSEKSSQQEDRPRFTQQARSSKGVVSRQITPAEKQEIGEETSQLQREIEESVKIPEGQFQTPAAPKVPKAPPLP